MVGWGARAPWAAPDARTVSRWLADRLADLGVDHAFGVLGGGIAPFSAGLAASPIRICHTRHECGAAFAAIEAHFATGRPTAVVVTTGPGLFNALNGMMAARADGARVLLISAATSRAQLGRGAVQETGPLTIPAGLTTAGPLFHHAAVPESMTELHHFLQQLACGWARPGGFVAHLALPWSLQTQLLSAEPPALGRWTVSEPLAPLSALDATLDALATGRTALWIGHGARAAAAELRTFALASGLPVISSPRAKGVFDEDHPQFVGVSGAGGHDTVGTFLASRPDTLLVLGTRLGRSPRSSRRRRSRPGAGSTSTSIPRRSPPRSRAPMASASSPTSAGSWPRSTAGPATPAGTRATPARRRCPTSAARRR